MVLHNIYQQTGVAIELLGGQSSTLKKTFKSLQRMHRVDSLGFRFWGLGFRPAWGAGYHLAPYLLDGLAGAKRVEWGGAQAFQQLHCL